MLLPLKRKLFGGRFTGTFQTVAHLHLVPITLRNCGDVGKFWGFKQGGEKKPRNQKPGG